MTTKKWQGTIRGLGGCPHLLASSLKSYVLPKYSTHTSTEKRPRVLWKPFSVFSSTRIWVFLFFLFQLFTKMTQFVKYDAKLFSAIFTYIKIEKTTDTYKNLTNFFGCDSFTPNLQSPNKIFECYIIRLNWSLWKRTILPSRKFFIFP